MRLSADDEARLLSRTTALAVRETAIGATIRASPTTFSEVDPGALPRITLAPGVSSGGAESLAPADLVVRAILGEGGMGRVHLAEQRSLGRDVAVKTLKPGAPPEIGHALLREARVTGLLEHPGVIPVHALGIDSEGQPVLVMKRVEGASFGARLAGRPARGEALVAALETLMRVCETVEFAHARGVIHRDIKPENVMVGGFGEVYLLDWGIATTERAPDTSLVGTPAYMAPEMVLGEPVDARTDVYLLGATLHEVLTGAPRHGGASIVEAARAATLSEPVAYEADVDPVLADLANRATSRERAQRPPTARALRDELAEHLRHRSARTLAEAALVRVAELEERLGAGGLPADLPAAYRLVSEARFGLAQALETAASLPQAREGMRRCLRAAVELELRQEHVESAAALLAELDESDEGLAARLAALRLELEARAREQARLEELASGLDPERGAKRRTGPLLAVWFMFTAIGVYLSASPGRITHTSMLIAAAVGVVFVVGGFYVRRNSVGMRNPFNRKAAGFLIVGALAALSNRLVATHTGRSAHETLATDLLFFVVVASSAALTLHPNLFACAVPPLLGAVAALVWPDDVGPIFTASASVMILVGGGALVRARRAD